MQRALMDSLLSVTARMLSWHPRKAKLKIFGWQEREDGLRPRCGHSAVVTCSSKAKRGVAHSTWECLVMCRGVGRRARRRHVVHVRYGARSREVEVKSDFLVDRALTKRDGRKRAGFGWMKPDR
eukprot:4072659-Pleurochrysis_carterae.AAC.4